MTEMVRHRGPDYSGYWMDADAGIALGHRRLAIVDLTSAGSQPMLSDSGRYVIAFNGEIYNHMDLRADLERSGMAPVWRGHSDTETLLAGFDVWGISGTIKHCIGMFAFAVWDKQTRQLTICRDRLGEKPLYYGWVGDGRNAALLFSSELHALKPHPSFKAEVDRGALALLMRYGYIPAPYSIYRGIFKLDPGSSKTLSLVDRTPFPKKFWSGTAAVQKGLIKPFSGSSEQAVDALESLLRDAVRKQMMADVQVGAFLSGGVDSSTIVSLMQSVAREQGGLPTKTFTIGFKECGYNEAEHAQNVARHLGTDHHELYLTPTQVLDIIPEE
jgi:asparagine synthase (glutamine-hydrolysing)